MLFNFQLKTPNEGLVNITNEVTEAVSESGVNEGDMRGVLSAHHCRYNDQRKR